MTTLPCMMWIYYRWMINCDMIIPLMGHFMWPHPIYIRNIIIKHLLAAFCWWNANISNSWMACRIDTGDGDSKTMNFMFASKMHICRSNDPSTLRPESITHLRKTFLIWFQEKQQTSRFTAENSLHIFKTHTFLPKLNSSAHLFQCFFFLHRHVHDRAHRKRDTAKCFNQREVTRKRDRETGLSTLKHRISRINNLSIDDIVNVTIVNIELICNHQETPWCDCSRDEMGRKML